MVTVKFFIYCCCPDATVAMANNVSCSDGKNNCTCILNFGCTCLPGYEVTKAEDGNLTCIGILL